MARFYGSTCSYKYHPKFDRIDRDPGAYGKVYKARITERGDYSGPDNVAVKEIYFREEDYSYGKFEDRRGSSMVNKWESLLALKHPNVVAYYKVSIERRQSGRDVELVMDYYPDGTLAGFIKGVTRLGSFSLEKVVDFAQQVAQGLTFLHAKNIIHGDIKPANILIRRTGREAYQYGLSISDLDDRVVLRDNRTIRDLTCEKGTPRYMSQEMAAVALQASVEDPGRGTDVWSLGVTIVDLLDCHLGIGEKWLVHRTEAANAFQVKNGFTHDYTIKAKIVEGYIPRIGHADLPDLSKIIKSCFHLDRKKFDSAVMALQECKVRVTAEELVKKLKDLRLPVVNGYLGVAQTIGLCDSLRKNCLVPHVQEMRFIVRAILDYTTHMPQSPCHGGIFTENISYYSNSTSDLKLVPPESKDVFALWNEWLKTKSHNTAFMPPEIVLRFPDIGQVTEKVDSWMIGCLLVQLIDRSRTPWIIRRKWFSSGSHFFGPKIPSVLSELKAFYNDNSSETVFTGGPIPDWLEGLPHGCTDFLTHALQTDPSRRWDLLQLRNHPFVNLEISLDDISVFHRPISVPMSPENSLRLIGLRPHQFLNSSLRPLDEVCVQVADITWAAGHFRDQPKVADAWTFHLLDRAHKNEAYFITFSNSVQTEKEKDETKRWTESFGIRLKKYGSHKNITSHFGFHLLSATSLWKLTTLRIFTEHALGGNFENATDYCVPVHVLQIWIKSVVRGLYYLQEHGIVYRHLSSKYILFSEPVFRGVVKIGGCHNMQQLEMQQNCRFLFAEVRDLWDWEHAYLGRRSDIWRLGCIALQLATGKPLSYTDQTGQIIVDQDAVIMHSIIFKTLPNIPDWVPPPVRTFLVQCLQFNPDVRPTAKQLLEDPHGFCMESIVNVDCSREGELLPLETVSYWETYQE